MLEVSYLLSMAYPQAPAQANGHPAIHNTGLKSSSMGMLDGHLTR